ncbi:hypothetical protein GYMLUDRAFT_253215 [Collybiopsis luxurians FD-317 M1]|uniref:Uncharacterized protein n=1 Tax=Collybiopsis luxurians FD-317 M1 TaxID=944289 RepID=A0A0D0C616_9AGAR|nr:hypothetical protein GYMLUDRAFT_253215 [Collybiopsis luxurians FD-317 M1]
MASPMDTTTDSAMDTAMNPAAEKQLQDWIVRGQLRLPISLVQVINSVPDLKIPNSIWQCQGLKNKEVLMIRQEFHDALVSIIEWMKNGSPVEILPFISSETIHDQKEYFNPFNGNLTVTSEDARLVIIGQPGIGKTSFLRFIWALRIRLNLPTLYCGGPSMSVWKNNNQYSIPTNQCDWLMTIDFLPDETWCLIDSNNELLDIPLALKDSTLFVMQATSPRQGRLAWELIAGLQLQPRRARRTSPADLVQYFVTFGGSARDAYRVTRTLTNYTNTLRKAAENLDRSCLTASLSTDPLTEELVPEFPFVDDSLKHEFVSVFPIDDDNRCEYEFKPPTEFMLNMIWNAVAAKESTDRAKLFTSLLKSRDIVSATLAGHFYDHNFHPLFVANKTFPCYRMFPVRAKADAKTRSWRSYCDSEDPQYQAVTMQMINSLVYRFDNAEVIRGAETVFFPDVYYIPKAANFPSIDSFILKSETHVIAIQGSVKSVHPFKTVLFDWFHIHLPKVKTMEYIYLSPDTVRSVSIPFPVEIPDSIHCGVDPSFKPVIPRLSAKSIEDSGEYPYALKIVGIYHVHMPTELPTDVKI